MVYALVAGDYLTPRLIAGSSGVTMISAINDLFGTAFDWPMCSAITWTLLFTMLLAVTAAAFALRRITATRGGAGRA
jgi:spermidine/putrescine transport system permease protein